MDYEAFKKKIGELIGIDLTFYKSQQMDRRIHSLMQMWEVQTYEDYYALIKTNPQRNKEFVKKLTINVSEFYRNPDRFVELQQKILPELLNRFSTLRIWSAGCSDGSEPYSVAIIAHEMKIENRVKIIASDVDRQILEKAQLASYMPNELKNLPPGLLGKYFDANGSQFVLKHQIKNIIEFRHQNLLLDPFEAGWHLIICRNVVIYFTEEAKKMLYLKFFNALKPGGYLMVGGTEPLLNYRHLGFENITTAFYRKPLDEGGKPQ